MVELNGKNNQVDPDGTGGYEGKDVNLKGVFLVAAVVVVMIVVIVILLNEFFIISKERITYEQVLAPESAALRELRAREENLLGSYGVVDAQEGIYRVPIERAMQLLADEAYRARIGGADL
jgi:hypothetical protein